MLTATAGLAHLRPHYTDETRDLFRVLLNATSIAEASLALQELRDVVPEKALITACNLREVLHALPRSPFTMRVDEETLRRTFGLDKDVAALSKDLPDHLVLVMMTAGNLVLDFIVKDHGEKHFWTPIPMRDDCVNPEVVDLVVSSGYLLDEVIELVKCMGCVFNPRFYLSLEDWLDEHAAEVMDSLIGELF